MSIVKTDFGTVNGQEMTLITLKNSNGMTVAVTDFGATVVNILVPDRNGKFEDILLGYEDANGYATGTASHGAMVGRVANRIAKGKFTLNGKEYQLALNDNGINSLHGGTVGYNKRIWTIGELKDGDEPSASFTYTDPDGEENYPGTVQVQVTYTVTKDNGLKIDYFAKSDKDTVISLTNHSYFNLAGCTAGMIYDHQLKLHSDTYTPTDETLIPTGEIASVKGTMLDFTEFKRLGDGLEGDYAELKIQNGYDHNFLLGEPHTMRLAAEVKHEATGRAFDVYTDMPAIQLYTGNFLDSTEIGKGGKLIDFRCGFCLETQFTPNSPNMDNFPSCVLKAGDAYRFTTIYQFKTI